MKEHDTFSNDFFGGDNWFYVDKEHQRFLEVYYNPDSNSGGQIVEMDISYSLVMEAADTNGEDQEFFRYIDDNASVRFFDIDTPDYADVIQYYENSEPTFKNMEKSEMIRIAAESIARTHGEYGADFPFIADLRQNIDATKLVAAYEFANDIKQPNETYVRYNAPEDIWKTKWGITVEAFYKRLEEAFSSLGLRDYYEWKKSELSKRSISSISNAIKTRAFTSEEHWKSFEGNRFDNIENSEQPQRSHLAERRRVIMDMDGLGYVHSVNRQNGILRWESKANPKVILPIYELEEVQEFIALQKSSEYRRQVQAIFEYEVAQNVPEHERITTWVSGQNVSTARIDRGVSEKDIADKCASIQAKDNRSPSNNKTAFAAVDYRMDTAATELVAAYEEANRMPETARYTVWFGDMNMHEAKHDIGQAQFADRVHSALAKLNVPDYETYKNSALAKSRHSIVSKLAKKNEGVETLTVSEDEELSPKELLQQRLENGIRSVFDSEQFKNWLNTGSKFFYRNYSFQNALLIWKQKEKASYVMSYEKWKDFGRNVVRGAEGIKIFVPIMAYESKKGALFGNIKRSLNDMLAQDPTLNEVSYRLGTSALEFTMNRAHLIGYKINGKERQIFGSDDEVKRFIERVIVGKLPVGFTVGTVFDVSDVTIPEYLWLKRGYTKSEIAPDEKGNPVKNKRGEVRIYNTPERQARFQPALDMSITAKDSAKMQLLFEACAAVSERKGVPVNLSNKEDDEVLKGGASGYYAREFSKETPNGYIVIDEGLEPTEKCSVMFHEMGHADLHKNLEELAQQMGEDKIPSNMREVQAEAVAYSVASSFGIETDTSSFKYLAVYSKGFELQDFKKSLEVIFKETTALVNDIKAELDIRGLNLDLSEKKRALLDSETLKTLSTRSLDFYSEYNSSAQAAYDELPKLVKNNIGNNELIGILRSQKESLDKQRSDLDFLLSEIEHLNNAGTRAEQDESIEKIVSAIARIQSAEYDYEALSIQYIAIKSQSEKNIFTEFKQNPYETLESLKKEYASLADLSAVQIKYLALSRFVNEELIRHCDSTQAFVEKMVERATAISTVAAKNGTFVEVSHCEQWTDKPFFEKGTLCSPRIADTIIAGSEAQAKGLKAEALSKDEYFPYTKCYITVFTPDSNGGISALNTRIDIGDGSQISLEDHLKKICDDSESQRQLLDKFTEALKEPAYKRKLVVQDLSFVPGGETDVGSTKQQDKLMSRDEWAKHIETSKEIMRPDDALEVFKDYLNQLEAQEDGTGVKEKTEEQRQREQNYG